MTETMVEGLPSLAPWLRWTRDGKYVYCVRCRKALWDCPSCTDFQCGCQLSWLKKLKSKDRVGMPRQHYDKSYRPFIGTPPTLEENNPEDNDE